MAYSTLNCSPFWNFPFHNSLQSFPFYRRSFLSTNISFVERCCSRLSCLVHRKQIVILRQHFLFLIIHSMKAMQFGNLRCKLKWWLTHGWRVNGKRKSFHFAKFLRYIFLRFTSFHDENKHLLLKERRKFIIQILTTNNPSLIIIFTLQPLFSNVKFNMKLSQFRPQ